MKNNNSSYLWKQFIKDYWMLLEGRRRRFIFHTAIVSISAAIPFAIAFLLGKIIDFLVIHNPGDSLNQFYFLVIVIGFFGGFQVWFRFLGKNGLQTIAADIRKETRVSVMSKIMDLGLKWHEKEETGSKIQKINEGSQKLYDGLVNFSNEGISIIVGLVGGIILFLALDFKYLIFALFYILIYFSGENYFNKRLNYWEDKLNKIKEKVSGKMHESASNLLTVKSLGLNKTFKNANISYETKFYNIWRKTKNIQQLKFKTVKIFGALAYAGFILLVGFDALAGTITAGSVLVFVTYFSKMKGATDEITNKASSFIQVKSSVGRFMTIFGIRILDNEKNLLDIPKDWKTVEFVDVTFRYKEKDVLKNFNLRIKRGEKIGIVGKSGCGKSTLAKLILGLYPLKRGKILINGIELKKHKSKSITDTIGIVLQESEMFNITLLENVTISSPKKDLGKFKKTIKIAQLQELIKKLPKGINTLIGEKGYRLSGGERQRVGIARAIYKNNPMIILDEATSALDSKTESLIEKGIKQNFENKTLLVIAHRLSTLKNVDKIVVMEKGKIIEEGTYRDLLEKKGEFYKLWEQQKSWKN